MRRSDRPLWGSDPTSCCPYSPECVEGRFSEARMLQQVMNFEWRWCSLLAWILASLTQVMFQTRHGPLLLGVSVRVGQQQPASETPLTTMLCSKQCGCLRTHDKRKTPSNLTRCPAEMLTS
jgi:hypothetical protein